MILSFFKGQLWGIKAIECVELPTTAVLRECSRPLTVICVGTPWCAAWVASHLGSECFMKLFLCFWLGRLESHSDWVFPEGVRAGSARANWDLSHCSGGSVCYFLISVTIKHGWLLLSLPAPPSPGWARKLYAMSCYGLGLMSTEPAVFDIAIWKSTHVLILNPHVL